jgi:hypothetical protein
MGWRYYTASTATPAVFCHIWSALSTETRHITTGSPQDDVAPCLTARGAEDRGANAQTNAEIFDGSTNERAGERPLAPRGTGRRLRRDLSRHGDTEMAAWLWKMRCLYTFWRGSLTWFVPRARGPHAWQGDLFDDRICDGISCAPPDEPRQWSVKAVWPRG